jgi:transcriptional regulator with XRE-family HTH domain
VKLSALYVTERTVETVGDRVKRLRSALNWSQAELHRRSRVAQQRISALEAGSVEASRSLAPLARALGTTVDYLLTGQGMAPSGADAADFVAIPRFGAPTATEAAGWLKLSRSYLTELGVAHGDVAAVRATTADQVPNLVAAGALVIVNLRENVIADQGVYLLDLDTFTRLRFVRRRISDGALEIAGPDGGPPEIVPVPQLARVRVLGRGVAKLCAL